MLLLRQRFLCVLESHLAVYYSGKHLSVELVKLLLHVLFLLHTMQRLDEADLITAQTLVKLLYLAYQSEEGVFLLPLLELVVCAYQWHLLVVLKAGFVLP